MPDAAELRQHILKSHSRFQRTVPKAADDWNTSPASEARSMGEIAEHALKVDHYFATVIAEAIGVDPPPEREFPCATPDQALAGLGALTDATQAIIDGVSDDDLEKPSPVFGSVYGTMALAAHHMNLHTLEIRDV
jgi:uncharacterized damage-inducible protein DinB